MCLPFTAPDIEEGAAGVIALERRLIFTTAHVHYNMGAPFLALEVHTSKPKGQKTELLFLTLVYYVVNNKYC